MAQYVDRDVEIPGTELDLPKVHSLSGRVLRATRATRWYPNGRMEIAFQDGNKRMIPTDTFSESWLVSSGVMATISLESPAAAPPPSTNKKKAAASASRTPKRSSASKADGEGEKEEHQHFPVSTFQKGGRLSAMKAKLVPEAVGEPVQQEQDLEAPAAAQDTPPAEDEAGTNRGGLASPPAPSHMRRRRSSSGNSLPSTPTLQSALKKGMMPRTPSLKRVSFLGYAVEVTVVPRISAWANFVNFLVLVAVAVPALKIGYDVCSQPALDVAPPPPVPALDFSLANLTSLAWWQQLGYWKPLLFVNLLAFFNVDVLFWIVAQIQGSTWLIDPYWTLIPVLIHTFYQCHPLAQSDVWRSLAASTLLRLWAVRLAIVYLRREEWQFGAREDWRYTDLAKQFGRVWPIISFFATYLVQHIMLVGITLPLYAVFSSAEPWTVLDTVATVVATTGMAISYTADNELRDFMKENERRQAGGVPIQLILDSGLWHYSRHPNYFGEQLFWWGLSLYAVRLGQPWMVLGTLFNSLCMIPVTQMTEGRMLRRPERAELFKEYQRTTSVWVPWFKRA